MPRERRILLAEQDITFQARVQRLLANVPGVVLTVVQDGHAALVAAMTRRFDLMILDQNVPQISGDRVLRHLRASTCPNTDTPVIRLCAAAAPAAECSPRAGAVPPTLMNTVLQKNPLSDAALVAAVARLLAA
ncbi:response regulator [Fertoebacter nigrum]|uniref:Response regulator n=1 Tax=Fertoeibacter niger TaxID=2656921 RepID=A0A8X8KMU0_9RHOB|nr:response regulator [Fertoeibacter niger]NUB43320.1 response regulator [Fertoeibacter niger]